MLPTAPGGGAELLTASAAGPSQQTILRSVFQQVAEKQEMALETTDVRPLTGDDTMGSNSLYVAMSWIMAGFLIMAVLRGGAPNCAGSGSSCRCWRGGPWAWRCGCGSSSTC